MIDGGIRTVDKNGQPHFYSLVKRLVRYISLCRTITYATQTTISEIENHNWERMGELLDLMHGSGARVQPWSSATVFVPQRAIPTLQEMDGGSDDTIEGI
ncbi:hypothetical protein PBS_23780 [Paraburkholderia sp. 2C]